MRRWLKLPDFVLIVFFWLQLRTWICIILWFVAAPVMHHYQLGPVYILATCFAIIFINLGKRQAGEMRHVPVAYSIFNENFQELPGTLNADRLDQDIRAGQF
eukprot:SM000047S16921  [mRNA]  locus=s47:745081:746006:- [translate_table: standard]